MILKKHKTKWSDLEGFGGVKLFLEYPTIEQNDYLREVTFQIIYDNPNYAKKEDDTEIPLTKEQLATRRVLELKIAQLYIKFCVKKWEGVTAEDGTVIDCKLVNNEMDKDTFESFISNLEYLDVIRLGNTIYSEIEFNEADKKK